MRTRNGILAALGANVRRHRAARGWTQEQLAEAAGLDPTYISGIERGRRNPSILNVARLAKALGISTAGLCEGVDA
ncbi:MAG: XRE family transcriptional regulator [Verrucomicrobia bacterium]|nr:MAG: XRE family transcriptional regulator [Verrucomicrobiota bacterium]